MKKFFFFLIGLIVALVLAYFVYENTYNKPHKDYVNAEVAFEVNADALLTEYLEMMDAANEKYLDKVITIKGELSQIEDGYLLVNDQIVCTLAKDPGWHVEDFAPGSSISVKGRIVGFDDLLGEIRVDNCTVAP